MGISIVLLVIVGIGVLYPLVRRALPRLYGAHPAEPDTILVAPDEAPLAQDPAALTREHYEMRFIEFLAFASVDAADISVMRVGLDESRSPLFDDGVSQLEPALSRVFDITSHLFTGPDVAMQKLGIQAVVMAFSNIDQHAAVQAAKRLQTALAQSVGDEFSVSFGISTWHRGAPFSKRGLLAAADVAMLAAKRAGSNKIAVISAPVSMDETLRLASAEVVA